MCGDECDTTNNNYRLVYIFYGSTYLHVHFHVVLHVTINLEPEVIRTPWVLEWLSCMFP